MSLVIRDWFAGVDTAAQYSGFYLKAVEKWTTAILQFSAAGIFALLYAISRGAGNRDARILKFIVGGSSKGEFCASSKGDRFQSEYFPRISGQ
jgi:hypothetical protein